MRRQHKCSCLYVDNAPVPAVIHSHKLTPQAYVHHTMFNYSIAYSWTHMSRMHHVQTTKHYAQYTLRCVLKCVKNYCQFWCGRNLYKWSRWSKCQKLSYQAWKCTPSVYMTTTELDRENPDFPPYLISHGEKIGSTRVLLAMRSEVADCVCVHCKSDARNVDATYAPLKLRKATRI